MIAINEFSNRLKIQECHYFEQHRSIAISELYQTVWRNTTEDICLFFKKRCYERNVEMFEIVSSDSSENFFDLIEYADVFSENEINELSSHREFFDHVIDLFFEKNSFFESIYNLSENELKMLKDYINKNFVNEFIVRSKFSTETLILFIKKKNDKLKLRVDYRKLNVISIKNKYFISLIINILNKLKRTKIFTKLNIWEAYNLIKIKFENEWKTTFKTKYENFEYRVLSFELISNFATFQFYIDRILTNYFDKFCICYLNDIFIYLNNVREHNDHVKIVFTALRKHRLFVKLKKCSFERDWMNHLKFIINTENIVINSAKVKTIIFWSTSKFIKEMQSFLEFCNFYRRFIQEYSEMTLSMTNNTKMIKFLWTKNIQKSFDLLKKTFTKDILLKHFDSNRRIKINTDASEFVLTTIILQLQNNDYWHFISFHSRKLKNSKRNYVTHDQKLLVIVNAFKIWRHYLKKAKYEITVMCDHNNLKYFMTIKSFTKRQIHWTEFLISFEFKIKHRADKKNSTNAFSRKADYKSIEEMTFVSLLRLINITLKKTKKTIIEICHDLKIDDSNENTLITLSTTIDHNENDENLSEFSSTLLKNIKRHSKQNQIMKIIIINESNIFKMIDELIFHENNRIYVSKKVRLKMLKNFHDSSTAKHFERNKILKSIKKWFYWSKMNNFVKNYVKTCDICMKTKLFKHFFHDELLSLSTSNKA